MIRSFKIMLRHDTTRIIRRQTLLIYAKLPISHLCTSNGAVGYRYIDESASESTLSYGKHPNGTINLNKFTSLEPKLRLNYVNSMSKGELFEFANSTAARHEWTAVLDLIKLLPPHEVISSPLLKSLLDNLGNIDENVSLGI